MTVIRVEHERAYAVIANAALEDRRLSFRARGVLAFLLSRPDGWRIRSDHLAAHAQEGRDAIRSALTELEEAGYLTRGKRRDPATGRWTGEVVVRESPAPRNPAPDEPAPGGPPSDDQALKTQVLGSSTKSPPTPAQRGRRPRRTGTNPRAQGTSPRQRAAAEAERARTAQAAARAACTACTGTWIEDASGRMTPCPTCAPDLFARYGRGDGS